MEQITEKDTGTIDTKEQDAEKTPKKTCRKVGRPKRLGRPPKPKKRGRKPKKRIGRPPKPKKRGRPKKVGRPRKYRYPKPRKKKSEMKPRGGNNTSPCRIVDGIKVKKDGTPRKGNGKSGPYGRYRMATFLIDTRGDCGFTFRDYASERMRERIMPKPKTSEDYIRWINTKRARAIDGFFDRITWCHVTRPAMVTGVIQTPDGRKPIKPMVFYGEDMVTFPSGYKGFLNNAIKKAVIKCVRGMDDFRASIEYGGISLQCFHPDGVNLFLIRPLSDDGETVFRNAANRGTGLAGKVPKRYWFERLTREDLELDQNGRPIDNPSFAC